MIGLCLLLTALSATQDTGTAAKLGVLAVAPPPGPNPELTDLTAQLRDAMARRDPNVLEATELAGRMSSSDVNAPGSGHADAVDPGVAQALRPKLGPGLAFAPADRGPRIVEAARFLGLERVVAVSLTESSNRRYLMAAVYDVPRGTVQRQARVLLRKGTPSRTDITPLAEYLATGQALVEIIQEAPSEEAGGPCRELARTYAAALGYAQTCDGGGSANPCTEMRPSLAAHAGAEGFCDCPVRINVARKDSIDELLERFNQRGCKLVTCACPAITIGTSCRGRSPKWPGSCW